MGPCRVGARERSARRGRSRSGPGTSARRLVRTWPGGTEEGPGHGWSGGRTRCGLLCAARCARAGAAAARAAVGGRAALS